VAAVAAVADDAEYDDIYNDMRPGGGGSSAPSQQAPLPVQQQPQPQPQPLQAAPPQPAAVAPAQQQQQQGGLAPGTLAALMRDPAALKAMLEQRPELLQHLRRQMAALPKK
jgi:hypothetical protein